MRIRWMIVCCCCLLLFPSVAAATEMDTSAYLSDLHLEEIDEATEQYLEDTSFSELVQGILDGSITFSAEDWLDRGFEMAFGEIRTQTGLVIQLLAVSILAAILRQISGSFCGKEVGEMGFYVCYMILIVVLISTFFEITEAVVERVGQTADAFAVMLPVFLALAASSGNLTQTALMGPTMMGGCTLIAFLTKTIIVPVILVAVALEMTDKLSEQPLCERFAKLWKQGISWGM